MAVSPAGELPVEAITALPAEDRLAALQAWLYDEGERRLAGGLFEMVGPQAMRADHDQVIATAQQALRDAELPEEMATAAAVVLWSEEVVSCAHADLVTLFGDQVAGWVIGSLPPEPIEGDVQRWEAALAAYAVAPPPCQSLRMALLWGCLEHHDGDLLFAYREAQALSAAAPGLRQRCLERIEQRLAADGDGHGADRGR